MRENTNSGFFCSLTKPQSFADCVGDELPVGSNYHQDDDDENLHDADYYNDKDDVYNQEILGGLGASLRLQSWCLLCQPY